MLAKLARPDTELEALIDDLSYQFKRLKEEILDENQINTINVIIKHIVLDIIRYLEYTCAEYNVQVNHQEGTLFSIQFEYNQKIHKYLWDASNYSISHL